MENLRLEKRQEAKWKILAICNKINHTISIYSVNYPGRKGKNQLWITWYLWVYSWEYWKLKAFTWKEMALYPPLPFFLETEIPINAQAPFWFTMMNQKKLVIVNEYDTSFFLMFGAAISQYLKTYFLRLIQWSFSKQSFLSEL